MIHALGERRRYRKKPVEIEAMHWDGSLASALACCAWVNYGLGALTCFYQDNAIHVPTLEGRVRASPGDFIIRGIKGECYPCKPDVFALTYDEVLP